MSAVKTRKKMNEFRGLPPQKEPKRAKKDKVRISGYMWKELVGVFCNTFGCTVRQSCSGGHTRGHVVLKREVDGRTITFHIPCHGEIPRDTVTRIIKESGMTLEEFSKGVRKR